MYFRWYMLFILALVSLILTLMIMPSLISYLKVLKFGQVEREEGLESHKVKTGTPTMGGIGFVLIPVVVYLFGAAVFQLPLNLDCQILMLAYLGFGLIGFADDYTIVVRHTNEGLKPWVKFLAQSVLTLVIYFMYRSQYPDTLSIPVVHVMLNIGLLYFFVTFFLFTGTTNATNLTDGVDGLCAGQSIIALFALACIAFLQGQISVVFMAFLVIASLLGYLRYNYYPAKVFMGDTGSLALGGLMAAMAMLLKVELLFIVIAGVFVFETISVILQVLYFKRTGKRIFLMAPFHHHLEKKGLSEVQVVWRFWGMGILCAIAGLILYFV